MNKVYRKDVNLKAVYDLQYIRGRYSESAKKKACEHSHYEIVRQFAETYGLHNERCLEVGCGRGAFQDTVQDYTGLDISEAAGRSVRKPFVTATATEIPFMDDSFNAIWSVATLEHVPEPEKALSEMRRVLRDGGLLLLAPAWFCRPWAAKGYSVRPYSDLCWQEKLIKVSIPFRNSVVYRLPGVFFRRLRRLTCWRIRGRQPTSFLYKGLDPDYEHNWTSDSDAVNSMDPFEAILWFVSRGDKCLNYANLCSAFIVRTGGLFFRINKKGV